jgi:NADH:ubiquinone oxidoreductase subunit 5 (subunit L)/multisubunit Na+/H+ antiporter MnhA subunit
MVPAGIVGGLFHMLNNALYKSGLFLSAGAVEKQAGTTDLEQLGGLGKKMPLTFACFIITAVSISGLPPFNGFFSKELVYDAALERGWVFYLAALLGSFLTAASFLKLGHAAFLGKLNPSFKDTKEAPFSMLAPMVAIASVCIIFGVANFIPLNNFIQPILGVHRLEGHNFSGLPANMFLVAATLVVFLAALANHLYGFRKTGKGLGAVDHIHYAPFLSGIYRAAEKGYFDPYNIGMSLARVFSYIAWGLDRTIDWFYNVLVVKLTLAFSWIIRKLHTGSYAHYIVWSLAGAAAMLLFLLKSISA